MADLINRTARQAPTCLLKPCGTEGAYTRHRRRGEPIDDVCRAARRTRDNARRIRKRDGLQARAADKAVAAAVRILGRREVRVVRLPGANIPLGALACSDAPHPFVPDGHTGTSCMACFGWINDYRHTHRLAPTGVDRG